MTDKKDLIDIADRIEEEIKKDFEQVHLSKNLYNTIKRYNTADAVGIEIPAMIYNVKQYKLKHVIIYYYKGSYAERVNQQGGFSKGKVHKGYVERSITEGVKSWAKANKKSVKIRIE